jgi:hypothetical protein
MHGSHNHDTSSGDTGDAVRSSLPSASATNALGEPGPIRRALRPTCRTPVRPPGRAEALGRQPLPSAASVRCRLLRGMQSATRSHALGSLRVVGCRPLPVHQACQRGKEAQCVSHGAWARGSGAGEVARSPSERPSGHGWKGVREMGRGFETRPRTSRAAVST